jgi:hypothetical protein
MKQAHVWWDELTEKHGPLKVLMVLWVMTIVTIVILWFLLEPDKLSSMAGTLGIGVVALVGTVLTFVGKSD